MTNIKIPMYIANVKTTYKPEVGDVIIDQGFTQPICFTNDDEAIDLSLKAVEDYKDVTVTAIYKVAEYDPINGYIYSQNKELIYEKEKETDEEICINEESLGEEILQCS